MPFGKAVEELVYINFLVSVCFLLSNMLEYKEHLDRSSTFYLNMTRVFLKSLNIEYMLNIYTLTHNAANVPELRTIEDFLN